MHRFCKATRFKFLICFQRYAPEALKMETILRMLFLTLKVKLEYFVYESSQSTLSSLDQFDGAAGMAHAFLHHTKRVILPIELG